LNRAIVKVSEARASARASFPGEPSLTVWLLTQNAKTAALLDKRDG
jgi:hypothetical protein